MRPGSHSPGVYLPHLESAYPLWSTRWRGRGSRFLLPKILRHRARPSRSVARHLINHPRARGEMTFDRLAGPVVAPYNLAAISRPNPQRLPVVRDPARGLRLCLEAANHRALLVVHQVRPVARTLVHDPQAF